MAGQTPNIFGPDELGKRRCDLSNLRLKGTQSTLVIASDFWGEILQWAEENGWEPENNPDLYRSDTGLLVTAEDAFNLSDALEFIAGDLVLHELDVSDKFLKELINGLLKLSIFFQEGSFRIC